MSSGSGSASLTKRLWKCLEDEDSEGVHEVLSSVRELRRNWSPQDFDKFLGELPEMLPDKSSKNETGGSGQKTCSGLHRAARKLSHEVMRVLLEFGASADSVEENETPVFVVLKRLSECICESCTRKAVRCINVLGDFHADFSLRDKDNWTPLLVAANIQSYECTMALLQNRAPVDIKTHKNGFFRQHNPPSFISVLSEKLPNVILDIFDRSISVEGTKGTNDPDFEVALDLSVILPQGVTEQRNLTSVYSGDLAKRLTDKLHVVNQIFPKSKSPDAEGQDEHTQDCQEKRWTWCNRFKTCRTSSKDQYRPKREMGHLNDLLESHHLDTKVQNRILRHPLISVFADIKWRNLELIYVIFIILQVLVLLAYTAFLFIVIFVDCPYEIYTEFLRGKKLSIGHGGMKGVNLEIISDNLPTAEKLCEIQILSKVFASYVLVCVLAVLAKELNHAFMDFKAYVTDLLNYVQLGGLGSIVLTIIIAWDPLSPLYAWLYPVASFGIGISWCQLFVQVGRLPQLAIYVDMFAKIALNFCYCLSVYSFILVGFAMSYCILFPPKPEAIDIPLALIRVLSMMAGELDYEGLFDDKKDVIGDNGGGNGSAEGMADQGALHNRHPVAAHVWYVGVVIMLTLVLMNLLVGLAVSDIQRCRKDAEVVVMKRRLRYTAYLEKSYYLLTHFLPAIIKDFLRRRIAIIKPNADDGPCLSSRLVRVENFKIFIKPNDSKDRLLSKESKEAIKNWFSHHKTTKTKQVCKFSKTKGDSSNRNSAQESFSKDDTSPVKTEKWSDADEVQDTPKKSHTASSTSTGPVQIRRLERRLSDLDHKMDLLIATLTGRASSPD